MDTLIPNTFVIYRIHWLKIISCRLPVTSPAWFFLAELYRTILRYCDRTNVFLYDKNEWFYG